MNTLNNNGNYAAPEQQGHNAEVQPLIGFMPSSLSEVLLRNFWILLISTVLALAGGAYYLFKATPIFSSTSRVYVEQSGPKVLTDVEGVMTQSKNYLYTQAELLKSTPIVRKALDARGIRQMAMFDDVDNPIGFTKKTLQISVGKKDDIINISYESPYPAEAAELVNSVVDSYVVYQSSRKRTTAAEVLKILQKEKTKRAVELNQKLKAMIDFKKANAGMAFESGVGNTILDRLAMLSETMTRVQLDVIEAKTFYESLKTMVTEPAMLKEFIKSQRAKGVYVSTSGENDRLLAEIEQLESQMADIKEQVTTDAVVVRTLESKINKLKSQLDDHDSQFAQYQLTAARQNYLAAEENLRQINGHLEEQRKLAIELNEQIAQYTLLRSDWEQTRKLCDILDDRIKEINVTEDVGALNISILEVARPADKPFKPEKARIMAIALVSGLIIGVILSLVRDKMDHRLRSADEISAVVGVPVLGTIPSMSKKSSITNRGQRVHLEPTSAAAEAYRTVRTAVYFGAPNGQAKTLLITSPAPGDGKTTLVSNLAITMAKASQRTLILDADFRKPMQHKIFEIDDEKGLSNVISGQELLANVISKTIVDGLDILPCGPVPPNPSEMLNSKAFSSLLAELEGKYDRVLIDSPPVMPVTDARILGAICDITLLVLRAERSTRKTSQQARDGLLSVGTNILGTVINDIKRSKGRYGYYSGYGYGHYGYGYDGKRKTKRTTREATEPRSNE